MKILDYHPDRYKIPMPKTPITSTKASSSPPPRMQSQSKEYPNKNTKYANQNIKYTNQNTKHGGLPKITNMRYGSSLVGSSHWSMSPLIHAPIGANQTDKIKSLHRSGLIFLRAYLSLIDPEKNTLCHYIFL